MLKSFYKIFQLLSAGDEEATDEERQERCKFLNIVRANFTSCCGYPALVITDDIAVDCSSVCSEEPESVIGGKVASDYHYEFPDCSCTQTECTFKSMQVLIPKYGAKGDLLGYEIDFNGIVNSFLMSVGNDESWLPVLKDVVSRCYEQFSTSEGGLECNSVPSELFEIIDCSYKQNYLKCPSWNPQGLFECQYTYEYVTKCMDDAK